MPRDPARRARPGYEVISKRMGPRGLTLLIAGLKRLLTKLRLRPLPPPDDQMTVAAAVDRAADADEDRAAGFSLLQGRLQVFQAADRDPADFLNHVVQGQFLGQRAVWIDLQHEQAICA